MKKLLLTIFLSAIVGLSTTKAQTNVPLCFQNATQCSITVCLTIAVHCENTSGGSDQTVSVCKTIASGVTDCITYVDPFNPGTQCTYTVINMTMQSQPPTPGNDPTIIWYSDMLDGNVATSNGVSGCNGQGNIFGHWYNGKWVLTVVG